MNVMGVDCIAPVMNIPKQAFTFYESHDMVTVNQVRLKSHRFYVCLIS